MRIEYSANNSGGSWWLEDGHWKALEDAGWEVEWGGLYFCGGGAIVRGKNPPKNHVPCEDDDKCHGHRVYGSYEEAAGQERWLGALATSATKDFDGMADAIREWESLTGMSAADEGCNCCGPPHSFSNKDSESWEYASGEDCLQYLYPGAPTSFREALENLTDSKSEAP